MFVFSLTQYSHHVFPPNLKVLFVAKMLRMIGVQFSVFFFPLFLFTVGQEYRFFPVQSAFQQGMLFMGSYYFLERLGILVCTFPSVRFGYRIGLRNSMIVSQVLYMVSLGLLAASRHNPMLLILVIMIESVKIPLFWISYYSIFSSSALIRKMGRSVGTVEFFTKLLQAAVPAIAGLTITAFGFSEMFLIALTFQFLALGLLFFIHNPRTETIPNWNEFFSWMKEKQFRLFSVSVAGKYSVDVLQHLWPFFVFLLVGSADRVGYMYFVILFISLLVTYFAGWYIDHYKSRRPFSVSGSFLSGLWLIRLTAFNLWSIIAIDVFDRLAQSVYNPFYESILIRRGKGKKMFNYFTYREILVGFSSLVFWGIFLLYFSLFETWRSFLVFGFIGMLMSMQLRDRVPENTET